MCTQKQIVTVIALIAAVMLVAPAIAMGGMCSIAISVASTANESMLASLGDGGMHPSGLIPPPLDLSHIRASESRSVHLLMQEHLPAVYDLRSQGRVTPVKAQGHTGSCWAFSAIASLESHLLPGETRDFSENHMKNLCSRSYPEGFDHVPADGGNDVIATAYLARWTGPVNEEDDPYDDASDESPMDLLPEIHVQNVLFLPDLTGPDEAVALKRAIMEYGAVYTSMYMNENYPYYNYETAGYYYDGTEKSNHAVTVVGWNDTYDKNQFASIPPQDGAWIIKNSWGTKFGDDGYFYVSYCDSMMGTKNIVFTAENASNYDVIYQHDPLGWVGSIGTRGDTGWFAAVFTAESDEDLRAVSLYMGQCDSPYELYIYLSPADGPINTSGPVAAQTGVIDDAGYRTIPLDSPVALSPGQTFSIVMNLTTPGYDRPIPVEYPKPGYSSKATAKCGEGYVQIDGEWEDLTDKYKDYSPCLKAFTIVCKSLSIIGIAPDHGHRIVQAVNLSGTGFQNGATVKLTRMGQPDIVTTGVSVVSGSQIACTFNLYGCAEGLWDVVVENPDGETAVLREGFTVTTPLTLTANKDAIVRGDSVTVMVSGGSDHMYLIYIQAADNISPQEYPSIAPGQPGVSCINPGTILNVTATSCANVITTSLGNRSVRFDTNTSTRVGTYTIGVIDWTDPSQSSSLQVGVEQGDEPDLTANFTANVTSGPVPLTVQFTDESVGNATTWLWDFGDGNTSAEQSPFHTYTAPGNYTANLTATNASGSSNATKTIIVTGVATCDLTIGGVLNSIGGVVFAREPNTIRVTNIRNNGLEVSPATVLEVRSDDGWVDRVDVPPIEPGKNIISISIEDPTIRDLAGGTVTYTAEIDPDNTVIETDETNNIRSCPPKLVKYNGYKGKRYWEGGSDITTVRVYDLRGGIMHSFGDSRYVPGRSGSEEPWTNYTVTWVAGDLPLPESASARDVWLYVPYSWDDNNTMPDGISIDFNGVRVPHANWYTDVSNFGPYVDHYYGLLTYNVTSLFQMNANNTALFERNWPGKISPAGFTLAVVYEDASATRKQIFINEEFDLLGADPSFYGTNKTEATAYVPFSGMTIDTESVVRADLTTFVPWGNCGDGTRPGEGNLLFNGELIQEWVWDYGEDDSTQVAVDERDVWGRLRSTGNVAGIQCTEANSPVMVAAQVFLVVEYGEMTSAADFTANTTAGVAPLAVRFSDTSTGNATARLWDFGDCETSTKQNPEHIYTAPGNYTVALTINNDLSTETKHDYIKVTPLLFGDIDENGQINQADTLHVLQMVVGLVDLENKPKPGSEKFQKTDVNRNGVIDVGDALFIAQYNVGFRDVWFEIPATVAPYPYGNIFQ